MIAVDGISHSHGQGLRLFEGPEEQFPILGFPLLNNTDSPHGLERSLNAIELLWTCYAGAAHFVYGVLPYLSAVSHINVGVLLTANGHLRCQKTAASLIQQ